MSDLSLVAFRRHWDSGITIWMVVMLFTAVCLSARGNQPWLATYPSEWVSPLAAWVDDWSAVIIDDVQPAFRAIAALLKWPMLGMQASLQWLPWPMAMAIVGAIALRAGGYRLATFSIAALGYLLVTNYWSPSMNTLALVLLAVPMSVFAGFAIGVLAFRVRWAQATIEVALDVMQTMPAFAYLIPLLLLFGFGPVVGLIASAIYAIPFMVRNTILGFKRVPSELSEAGMMSGCTPRQRFWLVDVPTATPQLLVGVNQTTMAAFSIMIIASIIGGFADIGWEVLSAMRAAAFGQSLLSGLAIALLAMVMDRITLGLAGPDTVRAGPPWLTSRSLWIIIAAALGAAWLMRLTGVFVALPFDPTRGLINANAANQWILELVARFNGPIGAFKDGVLYYFILPLRVGMIRAVTPTSWGIALSPAVIAIYAALVTAIAITVYGRFGWRPALAVAVAALYFFFGFSAFPWPATIALVTTLAWRCAGLPVALFSLFVCVFILVTGLWEPFMQTAYLCGLAVLFCFTIGGTLGVWAAHSDTVSKVLRPVQDALQTMPQFVFLIPVLMFFKVGELTALIAIILYAIVPPIRYTEHGIRNVRVDCIEAGRQCGCTPTQLLFQVKLPLAMPNVMLGLNQTIMASLSMVVVAALVGTKDLGQQVYIALGNASAGAGLISGLAIALVAMVADRVIRGSYDRDSIYGDFEGEL
ncbi:ABC transporter permease subunit [Mesorhizobium sp. B2-4-9]|uniref:ABC transporter permease n=1 Tax=Mesorhizobium sp. B2-4-9 TaxID=2589940 RepID=UPI00112A0587|nr:ABC transporter permease subunit [Mesorhizobium sp. B2-4-9]TPL23483.1 ABC transporter permease subunit [Mesorhizobium sp. B2-4-9]